MNDLTRRQFLARGGAGLAGLVIAGSLSGRALAAIDAPHASGAGVPDALLDDLAAAVSELRRSFPYASGLFAAESGLSITRDRRGKRVGEAGFPRFGVSLRVFDGATFHEAATSDVSRDALIAAARGLARDAHRGVAKYTIAPLPKLEKRWRTPMQRDPASVPLEERVAMVDREFERVNWDDPRVRGARVQTDVNLSRRAFVDPTRRLVSDVTSVAHSATLFGFADGKPGFGFARIVGQGGLELATLPDARVEELRSDFVESFAYLPMEAGEYDVVFAPEVSGLLAHESFGHGVEMDQFVKDRALAREFLGKRVAAPIVSLYDDPSIAGARGSYPFDDEGAVAEPTKIIDAGTFVQPLTDLMSATWLGTKRTPNGRAQGFDRKVYARMSNTFIAKGETPPEAVLDSLKDGLYLQGFRNGIEDPQGWGIQFTAARAREYKNGKRTGRVFATPNVTGYVPDILNAITLVGSDFMLEPGTCGKGFKEFVPVTSGGPHLRTRARVS